jgi:hypothetical protein
MNEVFNPVEILLNAVPVINHRHFRLDYQCGVGFYSVSCHVFYLFRIVRCPRNG